MKWLLLGGNRPGRTTLIYCFEFLQSLIRDAGCEYANTHYVDGGVQTTVIDPLDGQRYALTLRPTKGTNDEICPDCDGEGFRYYDIDDPTEKCILCDGRGYLDRRDG